MSRQRADGHGGLATRGERVAIYARFSTDPHRDASIEHQVRICRTGAEPEGWHVAETIADCASSEATILCSGYQALVGMLRAGSIDIVLAESLDRFSRD
jgi:DNA invertase Pin-like site-specific DNA recombinase